jgi:hypothetical protein
MTYWRNTKTHFDNNLFDLDHLNPPIMISGLLCGNEEQRNVMASRYVVRCIHLPGYLILLSIAFSIVNGSGFGCAKCG